MLLKVLIADTVGGRIVQDSISLQGVGGEECLACLQEFFGESREILCWEEVPGETDGKKGQEPKQEERREGGDSNA